MQQVNVEQAKNNLSGLIKAALKGEDVIIEEEENAVKLVPFQTKKPRPQFGSAKGLITIKDNFDDPIEDFADYQ